MRLKRISKIDIQRKYVDWFQLSQGMTDFQCVWPMF